MAAVASITDASALNRYLVVIGPGVYTLSQPLVMKDYVSVAGSGQETTILSGAIGSDNEGSSSAIVVPAPPMPSSMT